MSEARKCWPEPIRARKKVAQPSPNHSHCIAKHGKKLRKKIAKLAFYSQKFEISCAKFGTQFLSNLCSYFDTRARGRALYNNTHPYPQEIFNFAYGSFVWVRKEIVILSLVSKVFPPRSCLPSGCFSCFCYAQNSLHNPIL